MDDCVAGFRPDESPGVNTVGRADIGYAPHPSTHSTQPEGGARRKHTRPPVNSINQYASPASSSEQLPSYDQYNKYPLNNNGKNYSSAGGTAGGNSYGTAGGTAYGTAGGTAGGSAPGSTQSAGAGGRGGGWRGSSNDLPQQHRGAYTDVPPTQKHPARRGYTEPRRLDFDDSAPNPNRGGNNTSYGGRGGGLAGAGAGVAGVGGVGGGAYVDNTDTVV